MKRILLSEKAAIAVKRMRDKIGSYECEKMLIADSMCQLARMLIHGKDEDSDLHYYANEILSAMGVIDDYNAMIDELSETRDHEWARYNLESRKDDNDESRYDCALDEKELAAVGKILEDEDVKVPGILTLEEMTLHEIAEITGLTDEGMYNKVRTLVNSEIAEKYNGV